MAFTLPPLNLNPSGWGPSTTQAAADLLPGYLKDLPFQPFSKGDRISKAADWTASRQPAASKHVGTITGFTFTVDDDDDSEFRLVDSRPSNRSKVHGRFRVGRGGARPGGNYRTQGGYGARQGGGGYMRGGGGGRPGHSYRGGFQRQGGRGGQSRQGPSHQSYGQRRYPGDSRRFDASININPEWGDPIETFEFSKITKLKETSQFPSDEDTSILLECGRVGYFNTEFGQRITPKQDKTLARNFTQERTFLKVTSSEDPNLRKFASQDKGNVFMTDSILSCLLAMSRSVLSWDLVVTKQNGQIWVDKRSTSRFDSISVNENATDCPDNNDSEVVNTPAKLSHEAVLAQNNFSQQVLLRDKMHSFPFTTPFATEANAATLAPVGYRYRSMPVTEDLTLIVRCEVDAVKQSRDGVSFVSVKTLNEYDAKVTGDWRKKLEIQRGGVLASELKNNMFKIQRWAIQAKLAGCDSIEIGFLTRQQPKDNTIHSILGLHSHSPQEFINQMNINLDQMWTLLVSLLRRIQQEDDGKYLLFKDPSVSAVKLYKLPQSAVAITEERPESSSSGGLQILK